MVKTLQKELADYTAGEDEDGDQTELAPRRIPVPAEMTGLRLDQCLAQLLPEHSRSRLQTWIREGRITLDGLAVCDVKRKLKGASLLEIQEAETPAILADMAEALPLDIVHEDEHILVLNKPAGLVVHPGSGNWSGTLLNGLLHHVPSLEQLPRAGIVHRLDKDTSGLMVVAKNLIAHTDLVRQLQARTVKRRYLALVWGSVGQDGMVDAPVGRHPSQRTKMAVVAGGREARTHYRVRQRFAQTCLVECVLETGRTHQIRVHMASIGHPLVGDPVYGPRRLPESPIAARHFPRQALHAYGLGLVHPVAQQAMYWEIGLPEDFKGLLEAMR